MRRTWACRGQSTAEYAVLFALVVGFAVAMQQFVKLRLQGSVHSAMTSYQNAVQGQGSGLVVTQFVGDAAGKVKTESTSTTDVVLDKADKGRVDTTSTSTTTVK